MDVSVLQGILTSLGCVLKEKPGGWDADLEDEGVMFSCRVDAYANRMRFMVPIVNLARAERQNLPPAAELMERCLKANFHSALDAKYAVQGGVLFSLFMHPLTTLTPEFVKDAFWQTVNLAKNTGDTFASAHLVYRGADAYAWEQRVAARAREAAAEQASAAIARARAAVAGDDVREPPAAFVCPIGLAVMEDPVVTPAGHSYERSAIQRALAHSSRDPFTGEELQLTQLLPNRALREVIEHWAREVLARAQGTPPSAP